MLLAHEKHPKQTPFLYIPVAIGFEWDGSDSVHRVIGIAEILNKHECNSIAEQNGRLDIKNTLGRMLLDISASEEPFRPFNCYCIRHRKGILCNSDRSSGAVVHEPYDNYRVTGHLIGVRTRVKRCLVQTGMTLPKDVISPVWQPRIKFISSVDRVAPTSGYRANEHLAEYHEPFKLAPADTVVPVSFGIPMLGGLRI